VQPGHGLYTPIGTFRYAMQELMVREAGPSRRTLSTTQAPMVGRGGCLQPRSGLPSGSVDPKHAPWCCSSFFRDKGVVGTTALMKDSVDTL
jgi:hypothetical protein